MVYYIVIISFLSLLLLYILISLKRLEEHFRENVEEKKNFGALRNKPSRFKNVLKGSREKALKNIGVRFTIIRRILFILWLLIVMFLIFFPFMGTFSKGVFSVLASTGTIFLGFAAKPFIENAIAGMVITLSKLFNVGDTIIIKENYGVVEDITLTHTIVKLWDWQRFVIPNVNMLRKNFINYTIIDESQWAKVEFFISYEADIEQVKELAIKIAKKSRYIKPNTEPNFWIMDMTPENIKCWIVGLADSPNNGWFFKTDFRSKFYIELKKLNIKPHFKYVVLSREL
jgi:small-conductance mechanosensitive channel